MLMSPTQFEFGDVFEKCWVVWCCICSSRNQTSTFVPVLFLVMKNITQNQSLAKKRKLLKDECRLVGRDATLTLESPQVLLTRVSFLYHEGGYDIYSGKGVLLLPVGLISTSLVKEDDTNGAMLLLLDPLSPSAYGDRGGFLC